MKFCWCTIKVKNMEESLKFYKEIVGLSVSRSFKAGPGMEISFLTDSSCFFYCSKSYALHIIKNYCILDSNTNNADGLIAC